jgi:hypothetical protein
MLFFQSWSRLGVAAFCWRESRFSVGYLGKTKECLCRVTFDLTREHQILIDCVESLHELVSLHGFPAVDLGQPFRLSAQGTAKFFECHISGPFTQQIIGNDPSLYLTFRLSGPDAFVDRGSQLLRIEAAIVNLTKHRLGPDRTIRLDDGIWGLS